MYRLKNILIDSQNHKKLCAINKLIFSLFILFIINIFAYSSPPLNKEYLKSKPNVFKPCRVMSHKNVLDLQNKGLIRKAYQKGVKTVSVNKILVIRVQFISHPIINTLEHSELLFENFKNYYNENSYGLLKTSATITQKVYDLYDISRYNNETETALQNLLNDTINLCQYDVDFTQYDHIMILHSGYGEEQSGNSNDLWSLYYEYIFDVNGKEFHGFIVVPDEASYGLSPLGVICHEYGHQLGLPDLYDTSVVGGQSTCGAWSLMDYPYGFDQTGKNPPHLDPWCKNYLKFIDLSERTVNETLINGILGDIESSPSTGYYKIPIEVAVDSEYFIVEYRKIDPVKNKYDLSIPGSGLLIWHIDDSIASNNLRINNGTVNSGNPNLGVDLIEKDVTSQYPPGQSSDAYIEGDIFKTPDSNTFSGLFSDTVVSNIKFNGEYAGCFIKKISATEILNIVKVTNFPNPAGKNYFHPKSASDVLTTFVVQCTRPPQKLNLNIYTFSGEKIKSIVKENFNLNPVPTEDYKWVFEYDWNGKNESNEDVASGMYLYKIDSDNEIKIKKLAIIR